ncbi:MAG TPA: class I SAM-dependent methyltransferase, partial [Edaphobacter sp.]|nr:class I SAM-dependent methyltransferase [Edaphobacter sp.]
PRRCIEPSRSGSRRSGCRATCSGSPDGCARAAARVPRRRRSALCMRAGCCTSSAVGATRRPPCCSPLYRESRSFAHEDWFARLTAAGFDSARPAFFLWEGVNVGIINAHTDTSWVGFEKQGFRQVKRTLDGWPQWQMDITMAPVVMP